MPLTPMEIPWKEASSLIIVSRVGVSERLGRSLANGHVVSSRVLPNSQQQQSHSQLTGSTDYRILMVKRSGLSSFMASAYVYPGGHVEIADYSSRWWQIFEQAGVSRDDLSRFSEGHMGPRPQMVTDPLTIAQAAGDDVDYLPGDIGLRIAAIRETFEETGILLLTHPSKTVANRTVPIGEDDNLAVDLSQWRDKVRNNAAAFIDLCAETRLCPDLWSLYEWSNWLTPISVGHKRFDTMFYICCLDVQPKVVLDNTEVTTLRWCTPLDMLDQHSQSKVFLAPPQVYELSRIHNLTTFNGVRDFAMRRGPVGTERWLPVIATYDDGAISYLPGDSQYPKEPDIIGRKPVPDYPHTLDEMRTNAMNLNRIELRGPTCVAFCNVQLTCDHLSPITYPPIQSGIQSML